LIWLWLASLFLPESFSEIQISGGYLAVSSCYLTLMTAGERGGNHVFEQDHGLSFKVNSTSKWKLPEE